MLISSQNVGKKSEAVAGRAVVVPSGGLLGGGSSVNIMLYSRAQGIDFDSWNMPGWSANDIIPLMSKLESYHGPGTKHHGKGGPVRISEGHYVGRKSQDDWMNTAERLGETVYADLENPEAVNNGWERALKYNTPEGLRHDSAHAYIHPLIDDGKHENLHILCESKVVRVLFDENKRANGVEYIPNPAYQIQTNLSPRQKFTVKARKLVVVSCGACGTPQVLERSGVGNPDVLNKAGVKVVADVPGVGENYDDHTLLFYTFNTKLGKYDTLDAFWRGQIPPEEAREKGVLSWNGCDAHSKFRPTEEEVATFDPKLKAAWEKDYKDEARRPLMMGATVAGRLGDPSTAPEASYYSLAIYSAYSYSRGYLHITGPEWEDPIDFDPGFLSDPDGLDVAMNVWAYKRLRKIMRSTDMYAGELQSSHPQFPEGSEAACASGVDSKSVVADPKYTAEDDAAIAKFLRENIGSCWHSAGTAKMAPKEKKGVVDEKLNVYGVTGLKVVDLSIMPTMVAANTNNTAYVVGEKGASIILAELGLDDADDSIY
jgi:alcohol oxidase